MVHTKKHHCLLTLSFSVLPLHWLQILYKTTQCGPSLPLWLYTASCLYPPFFFVPNRPTPSSHPPQTLLNWTASSLLCAELLALHLLPSLDTDSLEIPYFLAIIYYFDDFLSSIYLSSSFSLTVSVSSKWKGTLSIFIRVELPKTRRCCM